MNANKTEFKLEGAIFILSSWLQKLVNKITYLISNISSTESDVTICFTKVGITIDRLSIIGKSDLSDKIKWYVFQALALLILLYGYTSWTLTKLRDEKQDWNTQQCYVLFWTNSGISTQQNSNLRAAYLTSQTLQVKWTRHWGGSHWRSREELMSDILLHIYAHGLADMQRISFMNNVWTLDVI